MRRCDGRCRVQCRRRRIISSVFLKRRHASSGRVIFSYVFFRTRENCRTETLLLCFVRRNARNDLRIKRLNETHQQIDWNPSMLDGCLRLRVRSTRVSWTCRHRPRCSFRPPFPNRQPQPIRLFLFGFATRINYITDDCVEISFSCCR